MADIRIKDLATTAASTASDDFVAVDGSANGTRKLNAYSPTFGGNLTVSGTIASSARITAGNGFTATATVPTIVAASANFDYNSASSRGRIFVWGNDTSSVGTFELKLAKSDNSSLVTPVIVTSTETTLAGNLTVSGGTVTSGSGTLTLNSSANTVVLQSAGTTALTLDSSQNATFAGTIKVNAGAAENKITFDRTTSTNSAYVRWTTANSSNSVLGTGATGSDTNLTFYSYGGGGSALTLNYTTGNATFAGAIAIGNTVNTVSPTSPNRTITMVIGGTTYYIHAKTTND